MFAEPWPVFFADFGVVATLAGVPVRGIFDAASRLDDLVTPGVAGSGPQFVLPDSDIPGGPDAAHGQPLVLQGKTWTVVHVQPDGTGLTTLILRA